MKRDMLTVIVLGIFVLTPQRKPTNTFQKIISALRYL